MGFLRALLSGGCFILIAGCETIREFPKDDFRFFLEDGSAQGSLWATTATMPISGLSLDICAHPVLLATDIDSVEIGNSNFGK